jgi:hypothetical protein
MSENPDTSEPDLLDPRDPLWRATVEMAEHARDPDVPDDGDLAHGGRPGSRDRPSSQD